MKESRRRTKQCLRNLPRLRAGRKWNCRRPSELSPRLAAGGVHRAFAAGGLHRGGNPMPAVSSHFSHHVGSDANLHGVFLAVLAGTRRFAHASLLCADTARHQVLGLPRFPGLGLLSLPYIPMLPLPLEQRDQKATVRFAATVLPPYEAVI